MLKSSILSGEDLIFTYHDEDPAIPLVQFFLNHNNIPHRTVGEGGLTSIKIPKQHRVRIEECAYPVRNALRDLWGEL